MPKDSSSSGSSSEDLAAFQSVVVSFEEIASKQKQVAEQGKQRISRTRNRKCPSEKQAAGNGGGDNGPAPGPAHDSEDEDGPLDQLNPLQQKVAAALDFLMDGHLKVKEPGPKRRRREEKAAARAEAEAGGCGGFRFFARVELGAEVNLHPEEPPPLHGTRFPDAFRLRRAPTAEEAAAALPTLAVEGVAVLAAAAAAAARAAASTSCTSVGLSGPARTEVVTAADQSATHAERPSGSVAKARMVKGQKNFGVGVVLEGPPYVPHDERMKRLLGGRAASDTRLTC